jgi:hypothetical protein
VIRISTTHVSGRLETVVGLPPRGGCWDCELLRPPPPPSGRRGSGDILRSGHERFTPGGNLPTLSLGAALVIETSTKDVLHRP